MYFAALPLSLYIRSSALSAASGAFPLIRCKAGSFRSRWGDLSDHLIPSSESETTQSLPGAIDLAGQLAVTGPRSMAALVEQPYCLHSHRHCLTWPAADDSLSGTANPA